jgi:hypothetical protein
LYKADGSMLADPWKPLVQRLAPELSSDDFSCVRAPQQHQEQQQEQQQQQQQQQQQEQTEEENKFA